MPTDRPAPVLSVPEVMPTAEDLAGVATDTPKLITLLQRANKLVTKQALREAQHDEYVTAAQRRQFTSQRDLDTVHEQIKSAYRRIEFQLQAQTYAAWGAPAFVVIACEGFAPLLGNLKYAVEHADGIPFPRAPVPLLILPGPGDTGLKFGEDPTELRDLLPALYDSQFDDFPSRIIDMTPRQLELVASNAAIRVGVYDIIDSVKEHDDTLCLPTMLVRATRVGCAVTMAWVERRYGHLLETPVNGTVADTAEITPAVLQDITNGTLRLRGGAGSDEHPVHVQSAADQVLRLRGGAGSDVDTDEHMPDFETGAAGITARLAVAESALRAAAERAAAAERTAVELAARVAAQEAQHSAQVPEPQGTGSAPRTTTIMHSAVQKQLLQTVKPPTETDWCDTDPDAWCMKVERWLSIAGLLDQQDVVVKVVFAALPESARLAIAPASSSISADVWDGLDQFSTWSDLRAALLAHYRPRAQKAHLRALNNMKLIRGHGSQFKVEFLRRLDRLDAAYRPSPDRLMATLLRAQYAQIKLMPSVIQKHGQHRWLPDDWPILLDAMVDADIAVAESGQGPDIPPERPSSGGSGRSGPSTYAGSSGPGAGPSGSGGSAGIKRQYKRLRAQGRQHNAPAAAQQGTHVRTESDHSGGPSKQRKQMQKSVQQRCDFFKTLRWKDPQVQAWADAGLCLNCGGNGHIYKYCTAQPQPKRVLEPHK